MPTSINVVCPSCGRTADGHLDVYSGLGPTLLECPRCQRVFEGGREEWSRMGPGSRLWYVAFSLLAIAVGSTVIGFGAGFAYTAARLRQMEVTEPPEWLVVWLTLALWAISLLVIQTYRVVRSLRRTRTDIAAPFLATFWTVQLSLQYKALGLGMAWFAACALLGLTLGR